MATIVSDGRQLMFLHIPKCAGSTISEQLRRQIDCDPRFLFSGGFDHPRVGRIMGPHVPLPVMREVAPETFQKLYHYQSYAVTREPFERFISGIDQHLREFRRVDDIDAIPISELTRLVDKAMTRLAAEPVWVEMDLCHLTRQVDFVDLEGERLVGSLYDTRTLGELARDMATRHGVYVNPSFAYNRARDKLSGRSLGFLRRGARFLRRILPDESYRRLAGLAENALLQTANKKRLLGSDSVRAFVDDFYADDFELWASVRQAREGRVAQ